MTAYCFYFLFVRKQVACPSLLYGIVWITK